MKTKPRHDYEPIDGEFAGRVGKYDAWILMPGVGVAWTDGDQVKVTIHSWEQWKAGKLRHWPPGLTNRINAMRGMLGYG